MNIEPCPSGAQVGPTRGTEIVPTAKTQGHWNWLRPLKRLLSARGSQLLEFAIVVPTISLTLVGVTDYSGAFLLKHKLGNAAREAARVAVSNPLTDQSCSDATPCSIEAAADALVQYMNGIGLSASCITPTAPTSSGTLTWTYSCSSGLSLTINRGYTFTGSDGNPVQATQVTLSYPYNWLLSGFFGSQTQGTGSGIGSGQGLGQGLHGGLEEGVGGGSGGGNGRKRGNEGGKGPGKQKGHGRKIGSPHTIGQVLLPTPLTTTVVMENLN